MIDLKGRFFDIFKDISIFNAGPFNLIRPAQIGFTQPYLKSTMHFSYKHPLFFLLYVNYKKIKAWWQILLKGKEETQYPAYKERPFLLCLTDRWQKKDGGKPVSIHFHKIINALGREHCIACLWDADNNEHKIKINFERDFDFEAYSEYHLRAASAPLDKFDWTLLFSMYRMLTKIRKHKPVSEAEYRCIHVAMESFWNDFRYWKYVLSVLKPRVGFVLSNFGYESIIAAFKYHGLLTIQIQHGIKLPSDIYEIYPQQIIPFREKALFTDFMAVFGEFWQKQILQGYEYTKEQLLVWGHQLYDGFRTKDEMMNCLHINEPETIVLTVLSQPLELRENYFYSYLEWMLTGVEKKRVNAKIILKVHPSELRSEYDKLIQKYSSLIVVQNEYNINEIFRISNITISVCSLGIYEAAFFGLPIYLLDVKEYAHYIDDIVNTGVARKITFWQNPLTEKIDAPKYEPEFYIKPFDAEKVRNFCNALVTSDTLIVN